MSKAELELKKLCNNCKVDLPHSEFGKVKNGDAYGLRHICAACVRLKARAHYFNNLEAQRARSRKRVATPEGRLAIKRATFMAKYGLTLDQLERMKRERQHRCDICNEQTAKLNVDHCHATGAVRGLLCRQCNHGLGNFDDDTERMACAIEYLRLSKLT